MKLDFIARDRLFIDKTNMRHGRKTPDVADLLPTVRKRGIIQPLIVKPANDAGGHGIVAGCRRWTAIRCGPGFRPRWIRCWTGWRVWTVGRTTL